MYSFDLGSLMGAKQPWQTGWLRHCPTVVLCTKMTFSRWVWGSASGLFRVLCLLHEQYVWNWGFFYSTTLPQMFYSNWRPSLMFMQNRLFTYFSPNLLFSLFNSPCYRDVRGHVNDSLHFVHPLVCVSLSFIVLVRWLWHFGVICSCWLLWGCSKVLLVTVISETWSDRCRERWLQTMGW